MLHNALLLIKKIGRFAKKKGVLYVIYFAARTAVLLPVYLYLKVSHASFELDGKKYKYFYPLPSNKDWLNERCVEIPIVWSLVKKYRGKEILEVGNVLPNYFHVRHDVLDKYEQADGVINEDVVNYKPSKRYDLIVSISTIEHVGWEEKPQESKKIVKAIDNLKNLLLWGGELAVTLPIGFNPELNKFFDEGTIKFDKLHCLKRTAKIIWTEASWDDIKGLEFDTPFRGANGLLIGYIRKNTEVT